MDSISSQVEKLAIQDETNEDGRKIWIKAVKEKLRNQVWSLLESQELVEDYPPSCFGKIPHFLGSNYAAKKVTHLREFKTAQVIKVNPSLAQMQLRFLILMKGKTLLVPSPSLDTDFFYLLNQEREEIPKNKAHKWKTKKGANKFGEVLLDDWSKIAKIDMYVVGSVVVSPDGTRLGKGMGYAELEWGILYELGMVDQSTVVLTTVHDQQIIKTKDFDKSCSAIHDLPVDIIVTPTRYIRVQQRQQKPEVGILWDELSPEMITSSPILTVLHSKKEKTAIS